jgi:hypothetical protein
LPNLHGEAVASIEWPSSLTEQLIAYTDRLQVDAIAAAGSAVAFIHEKVVQRALLTPGWSGIADGIEVWSEDGQLVIGVRDDEMVSQAFALEYGDEVRPPSPLFRSMSADIREANQTMTAEMESKYGYGGRFSATGSASGPA